MTDTTPSLPELLAQLRDLGAAARAARLEAIRADRPALADELESLLPHAESPAAALDSGPPIDARGVLDAVESETMPLGLPERIAGYRVLRRLASGGMGVVYVAEQASPRRTVALKMLRQDVLSPNLLRRFRREAEILGRLQHEGIARIFDAGTVDVGAGEQPYFAMEFIQGRPITAFATGNDLDVRARLRLFVRVCEAVEHAHQKGVVHRDLKPDNVLVVEAGSGGVAQPKVLDFGVARATDADVGLTTLQTDAGQLIGTLPYMSPEQLSGDPSALDLRSDVYALGVLLFELLSGRLPHDLEGLSIADAAFEIRERDPTTLATLDEDFRGDLDTIVAKALEKEPARRYGSAAELAADVGRHLEHEPILARPASTWYQLERFYRRNKLLVGSAATVFALSVIAVIGLSLTTVRALRAESAAELRYREAEAIASFYDDVLQTVRESGVGPDVPVIEMIDQIAAGLEGGGLDEHPVVRARVLYTLGSVYRSLGQMTPAEELYARVVELRRAELGDEHPDTIDAMFELALSMQAGAPEPALALMDVVLPWLEEHEGPEHPRTIVGLSAIANALDNDPLRREESWDVYTDALARLERSIGHENEQAAVMMNNQGLLAIPLGRYEEGERLLKRAIELANTVPEVPSTQADIAAGHLGTLYTLTGRFEEAEPILRAGYESMLANYGREFVGTAMNGGKLANLLIELGRADEADGLLALGIEDLSRTMSPGHRYTLRLRQTQVGARMSQQRWAEGLELADAALADSIVEQGEVSFWTQDLRLVRAELLDQLGRPDEAAEERATAAAIEAQLRGD